MEPIAIIGVACKLPGAKNISEFWDRLISNDYENCLNSIPESRWDADKFYDSEIGVPGKIYQKIGGFLNSVEQFDSDQFDLDDDEALRMDPQQRIALELSWQALDVAHIKQSSLSGSRTGIYTAVSHVDQKRKLDDILESIHAENGINTYSCFVSNRLSYFYDTCGPSMSMDSACSSGLTALKIATNSLNDNEIDLAIVGGFNMFLMPHEWISSCAANTISPTGRIRPFDDRADGFLRSEGGIIYILMRAEDAKTQDKRVLGYISAIALNHNGRSNGITSPNGRSISSLLDSLLKQSNQFKSKIDYYEAHAVGTLIGDAIEISSINDYLSKSYPDKKTMAGSVKGVIGHTETLSSLVGMLKILICLSEEILFSLKDELILNKYIKKKLTTLFITNSDIKWKKTSSPRHAIVSALGFGGSNGMTVITGPEANDKISSPKPKIGVSLRAILILTAKDKMLLKKYSLAYIEKLDQLEDINIHSFCRQNSITDIDKENLIVVGKNKTEIKDVLNKFLNGNITNDYLYFNINNYDDHEFIYNMNDILKNINELSNMQLNNIVKHALIENIKLPWDNLLGDCECSLLSIPNISFSGKRNWYGPWINYCDDSVKSNSHI